MYYQIGKPSGSIKEQPENKPESKQQQKDIPAPKQVSKTVRVIHVLLHIYTHRNSNHQ